MSLLYNLNESTVVEKVTMKWPSDEYVIPAGTPMSRTGIANDKNAIGILANEARIKFHYPLSVAKHIGKEEPKGKQDYTFSIITSGFVNLTEAEASFGAKISEEAKSAMGEINFVNETEPASFGGGGGSNILEAVGSDTLTWDGNTEGKTVVSLMGQMNYYKVSDNVPTDDWLKTSIVTCTAQGTTIVTNMAEEWDSFVSLGGVTDELVMLSESVLVIKKPNAVLYETTFAETGIYFVEETMAQNIIVDIPNYKAFPPFKEQIKEEYIPDSVKGGGGDSIFAELVWGMDSIQIGDKSFATRDDVLSGNTIVSDADIKAMWDIISNKIICTKVYGEGVVICKFLSSDFDSDGNPRHIHISSGSDGAEIYSESASQ